MPAIQSKNTPLFNVLPLTAEVKCVAFWLSELKYLLSGLLQEEFASFDLEAPSLTLAAGS
jgi:hypothetical protein